LALLAKILTKLHSHTSALGLLVPAYDCHDPRDLGDRHHLDTAIWKDIVAGIASFRSIFKVSLGNGNSTAFWFDLWLGNHPLHERLSNLFSHSTHPNINVDVALSLGLCRSLGSHLTTVVVADLRTLSSELSHADILHDVPCLRNVHLTNKKLSNKCFYVNSLRHLQIDDVTTRVWRTVPPLKCKILCWMARKKRLPTNKRRF
jgi:hypothetical protein